MAKGGTGRVRTLGEIDLSRSAAAWISPYSQAEHLLRTRDWVLDLDRQSSDAVLLAALTHDIERHVPGGPQQDKSGAAWDDPEYLRAHSERSAQIVGTWLRSQGARPELGDEVVELILLHEVGGSPAADVLQAADSISFLETLSDVVVSWIRSGECSAEKAKLKHDWMLDRIRIEPARALAQPFYERAVAQIDTERRRVGSRAL
jgi:hypothetical protein